MSFDSPLFCFTSPQFLPEKSLFLEEHEENYLGINVSLQVEDCLSTMDSESNHSNSLATDFTASSNSLASLLHSATGEDNLSNHFDINETEKAMEKEGFSDLLSPSSSLSNPFKSLKRKEVEDSFISSNYNTTIAMMSSKNYEGDQKSNSILASPSILAESKPKKARTGEISDKQGSSSAQIIEIDNGMAISIADNATSASGTPKSQFDRRTATYLPQNKKGKQGKQQKLGNAAAATMLPTPTATVQASFLATTPLSAPSTVKYNFPRPNLSVVINKGSALFNSANNSLENPANLSSSSSNVSSPGVEGTGKDRLARKAELARANRTAKKNRLVELESQVKQLQQELEQERQRQSSSQGLSNQHIAIDAELSANINNLEQCLSSSAQSQPISTKFLTWLCTQKNESFYASSNNSALSGVEAPAASVGLWSDLWHNELGCNAQQLAQIHQLRGEIAQKKLNWTNHQQELTELTEKFRSAAVQRVQADADNLAALQAIFTPQQFADYCNWVKKYGEICLKINV
jgi:hypothetical protein